MSPIKPQSLREVMLFEQSYELGYDEGVLVSRAYYERELWRARHPIQAAMQRLKLWFARKVEGRLHG